MKEGRVNFGKGSVKLVQTILLISKMQDCGSLAKLGLGGNRSVFFCLKWKVETLVAGHAKNLSNCYGT